MVDKFDMQITNAKEPWLAVWLSSILAGLGQFYSGDRKKGVTFFIIQTILAIATTGTIVWFILDFSAVKILLAISFWIGTFVFSIYNYFDAYQTARLRNEGLQLHLPARKKQPFLALFLSSIIPGLGQIYNSQWLKGIGFFIAIAIIVGVLASLTIAGPFISPIFGIVAILWVLHDAYSQAAKINGEQPNLFERFGRKKVLTVITLWLLIPMFLAGTLTVAIRTYLLAPYKIPVDSMAPTLLKDDRIFADKWIYRFENPKRGDLIVFEYPLDRKKDFIKRVVGLPGEKIKIEGGHIYVNEELLTSPQFPKDRFYNNREDWQYGRSGQVIDIPTNSYFVIGDNPEKSSDSRYWGFVARQYIKAKGHWIWWPWDRHGKIDETSKRNGILPVQAKRDGISKQFYPSGKLQAEWLYKDGLLEGISREYYETGELKAETLYVNDQIHGVHKVYFKSGRTEFEFTYANGIRNGSSKWYYETGELHGEMTMKNGVPDGEGKTYFKDGTLAGESHFEMGNGYAKEFYENGAIKKESEMKDGVRISEKEYDLQGNLISPDKESQTT